ncbi:ribose-phosphate pyrophosphokinase [Desulfoprunum benzoelyticum]|uniref:Ribose-phosphate pyrophosphokinase n=1 Tax=Desulfoprunum benzoelyticum TaxID=1506996 RepID=A0A840UUJ4_9BACT|nr:ribose-phosphate diphosphokinase [Desulfoprunum benzoelyticum]MBB5348506.1 ribose-phosphate pyrophosphokinase [Desulfoprunum benzoelyticum]MBM9530159.1 ribose-phosphate pyrophosphokinase [Desulfoprunum benzoelyticum]
MSLKEDIILVANEASTDLARKVAARLDVPFSEMLRRRFADGETYHAFPRSISGKNLIIIGATHTEYSYQELLDLIQGGRYWNAASINVVIPYLGYSTMERAKPDSHEIPKGITRTRQIFKARPDFVAFVDLHSEAVLHAHGGEISTKHVWTDSLAVEKIQSMGLENFVLVSPDYGFSKRIARLASMLDCPHTAADKDRFDTDRTIVGQISSVVRGRTAVVCDDMIRTGGSIIQTAQRCLDAGAADVVVMATHLVLSGDSRDRFKASPIGRIIGSDTYPGSVSDELLDVYSVAPLLAEILEKHLQL